MKMIKAIILTLILSSTPKTVVTATVYNAVEEQCNADFKHTATMFKLDLNDPYRHRIIAVSRDLELKGFTMNKKVIISGTDKYDGEWTIRDRMNKRYKQRIDFLINQDMGLGRWEDVIIQLVKP